MSLQWQHGQRFELVDDSDSDAESDAVNSNEAPDSRRRGLLQQRDDDDDDDEESPPISSVNRIPEDDQLSSFGPPDALAGRKTRRKMERESLCFAVVALLLGGLCCACGGLSLYLALGGRSGPANKADLSRVDNR